MAPLPAVPMAIASQTPCWRGRRANEGDHIATPPAVSPSSTDMTPALSKILVAAMSACSWNDCAVEKPTCTDVHPLTSVMVRTPNSSRKTPIPSRRPNCWRLHDTTAPSAPASSKAVVRSTERPWSTDEVAARRRSERFQSSGTNTNRRTNPTSSPLKLTSIRRSPVDGSGTELSANVTTQSVRASRVDPSIDTSRSRWRGN